MANKLELTWVGKDEEIKLEPRILVENPALSNTAKDPNTENMLIHGDNLLALKALESKYAGRIKCIYIDVKVKCIECGKTQAQVAKEIDTTKAYVNRIIKKKENVLNNTLFGLWKLSDMTLS